MDGGGREALASCCCWSALGALSWDCALGWSAPSPHAGSTRIAARRSFGRMVNDATAWLYATLPLPRSWSRLRREAAAPGAAYTIPVVIADYNGGRYLVSMLGERSGWVPNIRAAGGRAVIKHGGRREVQLVEVPVSERAPIIQAYVKRAPGGRPHIKASPTTRSRSSSGSRTSTRCSASARGRERGGARLLRQRRPRYTSAMRIAVVGHVEHVTIARAAAVPGAGDIVHLADPVVIAGGGGGIAFFQLTKSDAEVHLFTAIGLDEAGTHVYHEIASAGATIHAALRQRPHTRDLVCHAGRRAHDLRRRRAAAPAARRPALVGRSWRHATPRTSRVRIPTR